MATTLATRTNGKYFWQEAAYEDGDKFWGIWPEGTDPTENDATECYTNEEAAQAGADNQVHEDAIAEAKRTGIPLYEVVEGVTNTNREPAWFILRNGHRIERRFCHADFDGSFDSVEDAEQGIEFLRSEEAQQKAADAEFPANMARVEKLAKMALKIYGSDQMKKIAQSLLDDAVKPAEKVAKVAGEDDAEFNSYDRTAPKGKGTYTIQLTVAASRLATIQKEADKAFGKMVLNVEKVTHASSRADRLSEAEGMVESAKGIVEELHSELDDWKSNLPESLSNGEKAEQLDEAISGLEEIEQALDVEFGNVEFPSMY